MTQARFEIIFLYSGRACRTPEVTSPPLGGGSSQGYVKSQPRNVKWAPYNAPLRRYKALINEIYITGNRKIFRKM